MEDLPRRARPPLDAPSPRARSVSPPNARDRRSRLGVQAAVHRNAASMSHSTSPSMERLPTNDQATEMRIRVRSQMWVPERVTVAEGNVRDHRTRDSGVGAFTSFDPYTSVPRGGADDVAGRARSPSDDPIGGNGDVGRRASAFGSGANGNGGDAAKTTFSGEDEPSHLWSPIADSGAGTVTGLSSRSESAVGMYAVGRPSSSADGAMDDLNVLSILELNTATARSAQQQQQQQQSLQPGVAIRVVEALTRRVSELEGEVERQAADFRRLKWALCGVAAVYAGSVLYARTSTVRW